MLPINHVKMGFFRNWHRFSATSFGGIPWTKEKEMVEKKCCIFLC